MTEWKFHLWLKTADMGLDAWMLVSAMSLHVTHKIKQEKLEMHVCRYVTMGVFVLNGCYAFMKLIEECDWNFVLNCLACKRMHAKQFRLVIFMLPAVNTCRVMTRWRVRYDNSATRFIHVLCCELLLVVASEDLRHLSDGKSWPSCHTNELLDTEANIVVVY